MTVRYFYTNTDWLQVFRILAAFCFGIAFGVILVHYVHAQDADPRYLCLSDNPTLKQKCEQEEANKLRDLQMRVEIWNLLNCSERDICTPVGNYTWNCDPNDEAFNITGHCDPDWNDTGIEDQSLVCFATQELADKYTKMFGNEDKIIIPCPSFKLPHQDDESGK